MTSNAVVLPCLLGLAGFALAASTPALSAGRAATDTDDAKNLAEACARSTCRTESRRVEFKWNGGGTSMQTSLRPYADQGQVIIYPEEAFEVDFAADGKAMDSPRFRRTLDQPDPPAAPGAGARAKVSLEFRQTDMGMMLQVRNELGYRVRYSAFMLVPQKDGSYWVGNTSICPVIPHGIGTEAWPHPIAMLILDKFQIVADNDNNCG